MLKKFRKNLLQLFLIIFFFYFFFFLFFYFYYLILLYYFNLIYFLFEEKLENYHLIGTVLVFIGVYLAKKKNVKKI